uniref:Uncharacterized protein TCIL3000_11_15130 n=1 Tax=Trypanosoma congolense (strain IL3000) TaxID=1068625 RepID=G0V2X3_TRYCI|nr:unnamed protein product [Trypanosoma congolense IL3000]
MHWRQTDFFEGLRSVPRDLEGLHNHKKKLKLILEKRYLIAPEAVEEALDPHSGEKFERTYADMISQVVSKFNRSTRCELKVRVDLRLAKGLQLMRQAGKEASPRSKEACGNKRAAEVAKSANRSSAAQQGMQQQQQQLSPRYPCFSLRSRDIGASPQGKASVDISDRSWHHGPKATANSARSQTPLAATPDLLSAVLRRTAGVTGSSATACSEGDSSVVKSDTCRSCMDVLFATPPMFEGFKAPLEFSPADSLTSKSPTLLQP